MGVGDEWVLVMGKGRSPSLCFVRLSLSSPLCAAAFVKKKEERIRPPLCGSSSAKNGIRSPFGLSVNTIERVEQVATWRELTGEGDKMG